MATIVKKPCKNHESYTYSGKEMSPLGLGYTAEAEEVGMVMEGRDKTMWMVGIKNGVKVWNRIPTQVAATVLKPLAKEKPIAEDKKEEEAPKKEPEIQPAEPEPVAAPEPPKATAPAAKKKAPVKKQAPVAAEAAVVEPVAAEVAVVADEPPAPKKKAPVKKKVAAAPDAAPAEAPAVKEKKPPTAFNVYMSYRVTQLKTERPEMDHKERFKQATADWKELSDEQKKAALEDARKWAEAQ